MITKLFFYPLLGLILVNSFLKGQTTILAINSTSKTIAQLNANDGSVINSSFITIPTQGTGTIKGIIQVQNKIWISDQTSNSIYIYNIDGSYSSTIPPTVGLSNIRGLNIVNNEVWVTVAGTANGATANTIKRFDFAGNPLGTYATIGSPFDVLDNNSGSAYVTSFNSEGIQTMSYSGTITGNLVQNGILSGIQQMNKTQDGNYILSVFSNTASSGNNQGVYLLSPTGSIINKWAISGPRGAIQAGNGNYLYTTGNGIYSLNPATGTSTQIIAGGYQYFGRLSGTLSVKDVEKTFQVSVYPNPTSRLIFIKSKEEVISASIYSMTGQLVKKFNEMKGNEGQIDISELSSSSYILKLQNKKGEIKSFKILKK